MNRNRILLIISLIILVALAGGFFIWINKNKSSPKQPTVKEPIINSHDGTSSPSPTSNTQTPKLFRPPLDKAAERVTKKPFGIYVTPKNSPVQPERFTGYHTGADFEIFPSELNSLVTVHAVCSGDLKRKETATGYGGVVIEDCVLNNEPITVIYGHLNINSVTLSDGATIKVGDPIGDLGAAYSTETDGERKHLHLGFHKGTEVNIKGYVQDKSNLSDWIDPCAYVCYD